MYAFQHDQGLLDQPSHQALLQYVPEGWKAYAHHMTLITPNDQKGTRLPERFLGSQASITVNAIAEDEKGNLIKGKLGKDLNTEDGYNAAKRCALSLIAQAKKICNGDLTKINSCIKITGFVNSTDEFIEQPKVINGASDLIVSIFGNSGMHTRAAVSTNSLPLGVSVEVDAIFELN